jgi:hypothetical protein
MYLTRYPVDNFHIGEGAGNRPRLLAKKDAQEMPNASQLESADFLLGVAAEAIRFYPRRRTSDGGRFNA